MEVSIGLKVKHIVAFQFMGQPRHSDQHRVLERIDFLVFLGSLG